jgi:hypothetical protein
MLIPPATACVRGTGRESLKIINSNLLGGDGDLQAPNVPARLPRTGWGGAAVARCWWIAVELQCRLQGRILRATAEP